MPRRSKTRPLEDLGELVSLMPWWAGVLLAAASYLLLHAVAGRPVVAPSLQPGQLGTALTHTALRSAAMVGQYLVPFVCLVGAGISAWRRRSRAGLLDGVTAGQPGNGVADMSWQDFERLVGEAFRRQGFRVVERGGSGADGGVDLVLRKDAEKFFVQCKHWRAYTVGVQPVRELYGVMASNNASGGFLVTSGTFTDEAIRFARGLNLELIDGVRLRRLIAEVSAPAPRRSVDQPPAQTPPQEAHGSVECPVCRGAMVRRTAKRGPSAGSIFWGCGGYPACRGTRPVDWKAARQIAAVGR